MLKTFKTSLKVKSAYKVNSFLYSLKQMPILKTLITNEVFADQDLKKIVVVISLLIELAKLLFFKFIYIFFLIVLPYLLIMEAKGEINSFLTTFVFLTLVGAIINNHSFEMSRDRYYAIFELKMNPKKFALSDYLFELIKNIVGFLPATLFFGTIFNLPIYISLLLPIFVVLSKIIGISLDIIYYEKTGSFNEKITSKKLLFVLFIIFLVSAYALPFFGIIISKNIFLILLLIVFLLSIISIKKIIKFNEYNKILKKVLSIDNIKRSEITNEKKLKEESIDSIDYTEKIISDKKGYAYFNELFEKRHSKILSKIIDKQIMWILIVFIAITIVVLIFPTVREDINSVVLESLPFIALIMYYLNRGIQLTQAMFMNCDHSMLTYSFYRTPKVILGLFKERLKTLIKYNIIPGTIIGICLGLLLFITGNTNNYLNYIIIVLSVISMSIFFSVHYLVLYYLFQPYNASTEVKSSTYNAAHVFTYAAIYFISDIPMSTILFGTGVIIFTIVYAIISLLIVYNRAPHTFKLRN